MQNDSHVLCWCEGCIDSCLSDYNPWLRLAACEIAYLNWLEIDENE